MAYAIHAERRKRKMNEKPLFTKWDMEEIRNAGNILMGVIARGSIPDNRWLERKKKEAKEALK